MNKFFKALSVFAAACSLCVPFALSACGDDPAPEPIKPTAQYTVTFDTDGGSAVASQQVEEGGHATKPADDPVKTNYIFSGWCKDKECENVFEFETEAITSDTTIYASWGSASDSVVAKFYWNYEGAAAEVFSTKNFVDGSRIADPGSPERTGFYFGGWYTEDGTQYTAMKKFTGSQNFYAKWQTIFKFEAEKTQLTGLTDDADLGLATDAGAKVGFNFSGSANGTNLIKGSQLASGGSYVSGLFYNKAYLQFEITSDKAATGATLKLVLSCEYADIKLTTKTYKIYVNGKTVKFSEISLGNGTAMSTDPGPRGGFKEIYINTIDLKEGQNIIKLEVNNSETPAGEAGTVDAASPAVDCIIVYSDTALTMKEYSNG